MPQHILILTDTLGITQGDAALAANLAEYVREIKPDDNVELMLIINDQIYDDNLSAFLHWEETLKKIGVQTILKKASECSEDDFSKYNHIVGYPFVGKYSRIIRKADVNCLFLCPYNFPITINPLYETNFSTGIGENELGIWLMKPVTDYPLNTIPKVKTARTNLNNPHEYFAYINADLIDKVINHSLANTSAFIEIVAGVEAEQKNDVIIYCNASKEDINPIESILPNLGFQNVIYSLDDTEKTYSNPLIENNRTLNIVNVFPLSQAAFRALLKESQPLCMVTGNTSIIEAISLGKIPIYQIMDFNKVFFEKLTQSPYLELNEFLDYLWDSDKRLLSESYLQNHQALEKQIQSIAANLDKHDIKVKLRELLSDFFENKEDKLIERYKKHYTDILYMFKDNDPSKYQESTNSNFRGICRFYARDESLFKDMVKMHENLQKLSPLQFDALSTELAINYKLIQFGEFVCISHFVNNPYKTNSTTLSDLSHADELSRMRTWSGTNFEPPLRPRSNTF